MLDCMPKLEEGTVGFGLSQADLLLIAGAAGIPSGLYRFQA